jgi:hypothetical protein
MFPQQRAVLLEAILLLQVELKIGVAETREKYLELELEQPSRPNLLDPIPSTEEEASEEEASVYKERD